MVGGIDAAAKARRTADAILERCRRILRETLRVVRSLQQRVQLDYQR